MLLRCSRVSLLLLCRSVLVCTLAVVFFAAQLAFAQTDSTTNLAEQLDRTPVEHFPRWQIDPALDFDWKFEEEQPVPAIDLGKLRSPYLTERIEEARRIVLLNANPELTGRVESLDILLEYLSSPPEDRMTLLAYLSAAMALGDSSNATTIWSAAQNDPSALQAVESWLVDKSPSIAEAVWRERLASAQAQSSSLYVALDGLGRVSNSQDAGAIKQWLEAESSYLPTRLAAARALGNVQESGLEPLARDILNSDLPQPELLAISLLNRHNSSAAIQICQDILTRELGDDTDTAAHAAAYQIIVQAEPELARQLAAKLREHPDSNVRLAVVEHLTNLGDFAALKVQGFSLRDSNGLVRRTVRANMLKHYGQSEEAQKFVIQVIGHYLDGDFAEGAEQALVMAVQLGLNRAATRIAPLLEHPEPRVHVRAAWALQELAKGDAIIALLMPEARRLTEKIAAGNSHITHDEESKLAFLFGAIGRNKYRPADEMLRKFVPKNGQLMREATRASAIWALGKIWEGSQNQELAGQLAGRALDGDPNDPEANIVKYTAAIAVGMIGDAATIKRLERVPESKPLPIGYAKEWALEQL